MGIFLLMVVLAYIMGSLPSGVWIGKTLKGIDIRQHGSKNSGATNAYRVLGPKYGIIVLIADALKGYLPLSIAKNIFGIEGNLIIILGVIAILGHTFSLFLNFNGGKGVATSLGVFLFLFPNGILTVVLIFILVTYISKYISLASIVSSAVLPILAIFLPIEEGMSRISLFLISLLVGGFVIYKHKSNIQRLINGTENKFNLKNK